MSGGGKRKPKVGKKKGGDGNNGMSNAVDPSCAQEYVGMNVSRVPTRCSRRVNLYNKRFPEFTEEDFQHLQDLSKPDECNYGANVAFNFKVVLKKGETVLDAKFFPSGSQIDYDSSKGAFGLNDIEVATLNVNKGGAAPTGDFEIYKPKNSGQTYKHTILILLLFSQYALNTNNHAAVHSILAAFISSNKIVAEKYHLSCESKEKAKKEAQKKIEKETLQAMERLMTVETYDALQPLAESVQGDLSIYDEKAREELEKLCVRITKVADAKQRNELFTIIKEGLAWNADTLFIDIISKAGVAFRNNQYQNVSALLRQQQMPVSGGKKKTTKGKTAKK